LAAEEVIEADNVVAAIEQPLAKMRAEEPRAAGD